MKFILTPSGARVPFEDASVDSALKILNDIEVSNGQPPAYRVEEPPKMMPGQEPYTAAELARLNSLLSAACLAEEVFSDDELELYAERRARGIKSR